MHSNLLCDNLITSILSAAFFTGLSYVLIKNECISTKVPSGKKNLWYNTLISMIHSSIVSVFCFICFYIEPYLWLNMCSFTPSDAAHIIANISVGYFCYDFCDIARRLNLAIQWPVLAHHVIVVVEFLTIGWYFSFYNYLVVALSCEVNTIFLHLRQLFHLSKVDKESFLYRANKHTNFITYLFFRMVTLSWMIIGTIVLNRNKFSRLIFVCGTFGMVCMVVINIILLKRLIRKDYLNAESKLKTT